MAGSPLLHVDGLCVDFPQRDGTRVAVVCDVSLELAAGQVLALVGESGSGKTMVGRSLLGLLPAGAQSRSRAMLFDGHDLATADIATWRRLRGGSIGMVFQEPMASLNPALTIGYQMAEALRLHGSLSDREIRAQSIAMLERVRVPNAEACLARYPHEFSGGMRQRIMLASVLLPRPRLLIADEPTTALDVVVQKEVLDIMTEVTRDLGASVLLITHDLALVAHYADSVAVMRRGEVVEAGRAADLLAAPAHAYTRALLASLPMAVPVAAEDAAARPPKVIVENAVIRHPGRVGLFRRQPSTPAVNGVSLTVHDGETLAIVGESGSGKSTLGWAMLGLLPLAEGRIDFPAHPGGLSDRRARARHAQLVFQDPHAALDPRMRALAIVEEGLGCVPGLSRAERRGRAEQAIADVAMTGLEHRLPHQLSGGQRQRLCLARALVMRPELLIADEPVAALDVTVQAQILALLDTLKTQYGFTCVFISHDLSVVRQIADRVAVMYRGALVEIGATEQIFATPAHAYTRALLAARPLLEPTGDGGYRLVRAAPDQKDDL